MCIRRETREKARRSLAFSRVSKPHTHITHMFRQCTSIVYIWKSLWHCSLNVFVTMIYLYIKIRLSDNDLHIKYILKYVTRTYKLRLSFYVNIKTISVRNKNVQTRIFYVLVTYSEYVICKTLWQRTFQRFCYVRIWFWCSTIKFKVISREYLPIWTIHFLIKILSPFQWNTLMIYLYIKIRLSDNDLHIKYILKYAW
jgi:hypothetical protein